MLLVREKRRRAGGSRTGIPALARRETKTCVGARVTGCGVERKRGKIHLRARDRGGGPRRAAAPDVPGAASSRLLPRPPALSQSRVLAGPASDGRRPSPAQAVCLGMYAASGQRRGLSRDPGDWLLPYGAAETGGRRPLRRVEPIVHPRSPRPVTSRGAPGSRPFPFPISPPPFLSGEGAARAAPHSPGVRLASRPCKAAVPAAPARTRPSGAPPATPGGGGDRESEGRVRSRPDGLVAPRGAGTTTTGSRRAATRRPVVGRSRRRTPVTVPRRRLGRLLLWCPPPTPFSPRHSRGLRVRTRRDAHPVDGQAALRRRTRRPFGPTVQVRRLRLGQSPGRRVYPRSTSNRKGVAGQSRKQCQTHLFARPGGQHPPSPHFHPPPVPRAILQAPSPTPPRKKKNRQEAIQRRRTSCHTDKE